MAYQPTDKDRQTVINAMVLGMDQDQTAKLLGITGKTLRAHFRDELNQGKNRRDTEVVGYLMERIRSGCTASTIFYLKTQCRWKEASAFELSGPDGGAIEVSEARSAIAAKLGKIADAGATQPVAAESQ